MTSIAPLRIVMMANNRSAVVDAVAAVGELTGVVDCTSPRSVSGKSRLGEIASSIYRRVRRVQSLSEWASSHGLHSTGYDPQRPGELAAWLTELAPDLLITCGAPLIPSVVFTVPRLGTINAHYAILPAYRGGSPILWQVLDEQEKGGVSIHFIDEGIDTGTVIARETTTLLTGASRRELFNATDQVAASLLSGVLEDLREDRLKSISQTPLSVETFARNMTMMELRQFIDWRGWTMHRLWRVLRYLEYWPEEFEMPTGWRSWLRWRVGNLRPGPAINSGEESLLDTYGWRMRVRHSEGTIDLLPRFGLRHLMRRIVKALT